MVLRLHLLKKVVMALLSSCVCGSCSVLSQLFTKSALLSLVCPLCCLKPWTESLRTLSLPLLRLRKPSLSCSPSCVFPLTFASWVPPPGLHAGKFPDLLQVQPKGFLSSQQGLHFKGVELLLGWEWGSGGRLPRV